MPFTPEQAAAIVAALDSKITQPCGGCGKFQRRFLPDLLLFSFQPQTPSLYGSNPYRVRSAAELYGKRDMPPPGTSDPPSALPCIAVVCTNCGHTEFYNVHALGVAQVLGIQALGGGTSGR